MRHGVGFPRADNPRAQGDASILQRFKDKPPIIVGAVPVDPTVCCRVVGHRDPSDAGEAQRGREDGLMLLEGLRGLRA
ncbi:MAG TPA: hypothetical protein DEP82_13280, partial [Arthrobacter bacterium]|nr:hypothetical protein [Arthrobacter sp.]